MRTIGKVAFLKLALISRLLFGDRSAHTPSHEGEIGAQSEKKMVEQFDNVTKNALRIQNQHDPSSRFVLFEPVDRFASRNRNSTTMGAIRSTTNHGDPERLTSTALIPVFSNQTTPDLFSINNPASSELMRLDSRSTNHTSRFRIHTNAQWGSDDSGAGGAGGEDVDGASSTAAPIVAVSKTTPAAPQQLQSSSSSSSPPLPPSAAPSQKTLLKHVLSPRTLLSWFLSHSSSHPSANLADRFASHDSPETDLKNQRTPTVLFLPYIQQNQQIRFFNFAARRKVAHQ